MTKEEAEAILAKCDEREKRGNEIIDRTMTKHESNTGNLLQDFVNDYMPPSQEFNDWLKEKCEHENFIDHCLMCGILWMEAWEIVYPDAQEKLEWLGDNDNEE